MPKRFVATEKWNKEWHQKLSPRLKCFWDYLCCNCDQAGVWDVNLTLASFQVGEPVSEADLVEFGDKVQVLPNGKWFIPSFIEFQYGVLNEAVAPHRGVLKLLAKNEIVLPKGNVRVTEGLRKTSVSLQEKEKDKDIKGGVGGNWRMAKPSLEEVRLQCAKIGLPESEAQGFINFYESNGWRVGKNPMRSWSHALSNWKRRWEETGRTKGATTTKPGLNEEWVKGL